MTSLALLEARVVSLEGKVRQLKEEVQEMRGLKHEVEDLKKWRQLFLRAKGAMASPVGRDPGRLRADQMPGVPSPSDPETEDHGIVVRIPRTHQTRSPFRSD